jgi:hypothetical protein
MDAWDVSDPFVIHKLIDPTALSLEDRWVERKLTGVHLLKNWGKLTLQQCRAWQRDSYDYASLKDLTSMVEWARTLMMNSCDALLVEQIDKKFEDLSLSNQGGITYIELALDECLPSATMFLLPSKVSFRILPKMALPRILMRMSVLPLSRLLPLLKDWLKYLPSLVSVPFNFLKDSQSVLLPFSGRLLVLVGKCLRQLQTLTTFHDSAHLSGIKKLCKEANDMFNSLNISKEWNIPQKHRIDACFNCGDPDHGVPKCPNPSIKQGSTEPSLNSPNQEADVMAVALGEMAKDVDVVQAKDVVIAIKPSLTESGRTTLRV